MRKTAREQRTERLSHIDRSEFVRDVETVIKAQVACVIDPECWPETDDEIIVASRDRIEALCRKYEGVEVEEIIRLTLSNLRRGAHRNAA